MGDMGGESSECCKQSLIRDSDRSSERCEKSFFFFIKSSEFDKDQYCIAPPSSSSWDFPVFAQLLAFPET